MRKLILATAALAFLSSTAFAQSTDKTGGTKAPMSKGDVSKNKMASKKKSKKSAKKSGDDTTKQ